MGLQPVAQARRELAVERSGIYACWTWQARFFVASDSNGETRVWDRTRPDALSVLRGHTKAVTAVAIAPDDATLVTGSDDQSARLWDLNSGRQLALYPGQGFAISTVAYSPDGKLIATRAKDGTARIWYAGVNELKEVARRRMPQRLSPAPTL